MVLKVQVVVVQKVMVPKKKKLMFQVMVPKKKKKLKLKLKFTLQERDCLKMVMIPLKPSANNPLKPTPPRFKKVNILREKLETCSKAVTCKAVTVTVTCSKAVTCKAVTVTVTCSK